MSLAILIPTFNRPRHLQLCLGAIAEQTQEPDEIWILNDGGDPNPVEELAYALLGEVNVFHSPAKKAPSTNCFGINSVLPRIQADKVLRIDDDTVLNPTAVAAHMQFPFDVMVSGGISRASHLAIETLPKTGFYRHVQQFRYVVEPRATHEGFEEWVALLNKPSSFFWGSFGCHLAYPKEALIEIGGFNTLYPISRHTDIDVAARLTYHGVKVISDPSITSIHIDDHCPEGVDPATYHAKLSYSKELLDQCDTLFQNTLKSCSFRD